MAQKKSIKTTKKEMKKHEEIYIHVTKRSVKYFFLSLLALIGYFLNSLWIKAIALKLGFPKAIPFNSVSVLILFPALISLVLMILIGFLVSGITKCNDEEHRIVSRLIASILVIIITVLAYGPHVVHIVTGSMVIVCVMGGTDINEE